MSNIDNIKKIDELLQDDDNLEKYIDEINKTQIETPSNLKERILSKVNKKKKVYYVDICKIAACLIFSLAICRTDLIKNDNISKFKEEEKETTSISINEKISDFCKWFTTPLEIEEEEK